MVRKNRNCLKSTHSYYLLSEVISKINNNEFLIKPNALECAFNDFGWRHDDIIKAFKLLKPRHYNKTDYSTARPGFVLDFYNGTIMSEHIYTHFYIGDDGILVINSFKQYNTR